MQSMKKQTGFTLIELMITTIILVVMVGAAVPSMKWLFDRKNIDSLKSTFEKSLIHARNEAVQRGQPVRITPKVVTADGDASDWSQGWDVNIVTDVTANTLQLLRTYDGYDGDIVFTSATFDSSTPLIIQPTGQANTGNFTINQKDCSGGNRYIYTVLASGLLDRSLVTCN
jgi:prepilin-type N-terminal cleavage/methylation domain-containing protein